MTKSFAPEFKIHGEWSGNAQRFGTYEEANDSARDRFMVWTMPDEYRVVESDDAVNYTRADGRDKRL